MVHVAGAAPGLREPAGRGSAGDHTLSPTAGDSISATPGVGSSRQAALEVKFPPARRLSAPAAVQEQLGPMSPCPQDPAGMSCGQRSAARHRRPLGPRSPGGLAAERGRQPVPTGRAALPSWCLRFAPALFPLQISCLPPGFPPCLHQPSPLALGGPPTIWHCSVGCRVKRQSLLGFGGQTPFLPLPKPLSPQLLGLHYVGVFPCHCAMAPGSVG